MLFESKILTVSVVLHASYYITVIHMEEIIGHNYRSLYFLFWSTADTDGTHRAELNSRGNKNFTMIILNIKKYSLT